MKLSAARAQSGDFVGSMLGETGVGTRGIKLEITESAIMREMDLIIPRLRYLHTQGGRQVQGFLCSRPLSRAELTGYPDRGSAVRSRLSGAGRAPGRIVAG